MALDISSATIGYDAGGVRNLLDEINTGCIIDTIKKMDTELNNLFTSVDAAWVGASAEQFKKNMTTDKNDIANALKESYDSIEKQFNQVVNAMKEVDENLIQGREGGN